jgi:hypothetical protein
VKARAGTKSKDIHSFGIPPLKFDASGYVDLISWQECTVTEPALTRTISHQQIKHWVKKGKVDFMEISGSHGGEYEV